MRIGYVPYSRELTQPGDRRRFPFYAESRGIEFDLAELDQDYDVVVVTPRTDLDAWARYRPGNAKLVFDIVDSYLDVPASSPKQLLRGPVKFLAGEARHPFVSYRSALERILRRADASTCATPEQASRIAPLCANVHPILDFHSRIVSHVKETYTAGDPFRLVWEGLGENVRWFSEIRAPLADLASERPLLLELITAPRFKQISQRFWTRDTARIAARHFDDVRVHAWSEETVSRIATACDLAVIPLPLDRPLETGKPESKLVSFWRMGMPVVASATPAYERVMRAAGQDLACRTDREWEAALRRMAGDEHERECAGRGGREFVASAYSDERLLAAWDAVFDSLG